MPTVLRQSGYRFFFYSNEGTPLERPHIHVRRAERTAKFWLKPEVTLAESFWMSVRELRTLERIIRQKRDFLERAWHEFFGRAGSR